jgi:hypothetical protein
MNCFFVIHFILYTPMNTTTTNKEDADVAHERYIANKLRLEFPTGRMSKYDFMCLEFAIEKYEKENPTKRWNMWDPTKT